MDIAELALYAKALDDAGFILWPLTKREPVYSADNYLGDTVRRRPWVLPVPAAAGVAECRVHPITGEVQVWVPEPEETEALRLRAWLAAAVHGDQTAGRSAPGHALKHARARGADGIAP